MFKNILIGGKTIISKITLLYSIKNKFFNKFGRVEKGIHLNVNLSQTVHVIID